MTLTAINNPTKIDLAEETSLLGVDVPTEVDEFLPEKEPVFLGYQKRWFEDESDIMVAEKSRRTGLTWAESGRNVMTSSKPRSRGGRNTFYVGSKQEMALEYIAACALFAKAFNMMAKADVYEQTFWDSDKKEEILTYMIRFPNSGFKIQALSSRPSNLRGLQGDVVIDEAAFHEALEELIKAALALTMWGAKVRLISTHNGVDNLFNQIIQDSRAGKLDYSVHRITLADAVKDGLYRRICYVTGQEWTPEADAAWVKKEYAKYPDIELAKEELGCVPRKSGGNYLSRVQIEASMVADRSIPVLRFEAPKEFESWSEAMREAEVKDWCDENLKPLLATLDDQNRHVFGEDFARSGDLTVFLPLAIRSDLTKRAPFVVELRNVTYDQQKQVMFYILNRLPRLTGAAFDATGNGGYLAEAAALQLGLEMVDRVSLSQSWYGEWMPKLKAEFESFSLELPRSQAVLDDLLHIKVNNGIPQIDKGRQKDLQSNSKKGKRHGDIAVALAMAIRASWMDGGGEIDFTALPDKADPWGDVDDDDDLTSLANSFSKGAW